MPRLVWEHSRALWTHVSATKLPQIISPWVFHPQAGGLCLQETVPSSGPPKCPWKHSSQTCHETSHSLLVRPAPQLSDPAVPPSVDHSMSKNGAKGSHHFCWLSIFLIKDFNITIILDLLLKSPTSNSNISGVSPAQLSA